MKRVLVFATTGLVLALGLNGAASAETLLDGNAEAGKAKAAVCASCHGADGNSASGQFPKLAGQHAIYLYRQLQLYKSGERQNAIMKGMAANLSEQDMKDLAVYFSEQQVLIGAANPELVELGRSLYLGGDAERNIPACSGCHGPVGLGNPAASYPRISAQHPEYLVVELKAYRAGERGDYPLGGIMQDVARNLTDEDIEALASFLSGLHESRANTEDQAQ